MRNKADNSQHPFIIKSSSKLSEEKKDYTLLPQRPSRTKHGHYTEPEEPEVIP